MSRDFAIALALSAVMGLSRADADDQADELARLAGEYVAESSVRTGQVPADKEVLKDLTLKISKNDWMQTFRGDAAPYKITLDLTRDSKALQLTHQKVKAVRYCVYVLKDDRLTVTEELGEVGDVRVTVWKRKPPSF